MWIYWHPVITITKDNLHSFLEVANDLKIRGLSEEFQTSLGYYKAEKGNPNEVILSNEHSSITDKIDESKIDSPSYKSTDKPEQLPLEDFSRSEPIEKRRAFRDDNHKSDGLGIH